MENTSAAEKRVLEQQDDEENNLESYFEGMKDEDFTKAIDKLTTKNKK